MRGRDWLGQLHLSAALLWQITRGVAVRSELDTVV